MKGRAHALLTQVRSACDGRPFRFARAILLARVVPEEIGPDHDAPEVEARLLETLASLRGEASPS